MEGYQEQSISFKGQTESPLNLARNSLRNFVLERMNCDPPGAEKSSDYKIPEPIGRVKLSVQDERIIYQARQKIPPLQKILSEAIESTKKASPRILAPEYIETHFSECVTTLEPKAFEIYLDHERKTFLSAIDTWIAQNESAIKSLSERGLSSSDFAKEVIKLFYPLVQRLEFRSGQTRKARGGRTFELVIGYLLGRIGISYQKPKGKQQTKILKRVDFVIPDQMTAIERPDKAYFLSCKRTLRERWKQTIPERKPSWRVFLLTQDEDLPEGKAKEIDQLGMIVYVRDELKGEDYLTEKPWVRKLSDLPKDLRFS